MTSGQWAVVVGGEGGPHETVTLHYTIKGPLRGEGQMLQLACQF